MDHGDLFPCKIDFTVKKKARQIRPGFSIDENMTFEEFRLSLARATPPENISDLLKALWYDGKNDWQSAHNIAQDIHTTQGSWIHAYLHRKEGDEGNASYWYSRAGKPFFKKSLSEEWDLLVKEFLEHK